MITSVFQESSILLHYSQHKTVVKQGMIMINGLFDAQQPLRFLSTFLEIWVIVKFDIKNLQSCAATVHLVYFVVLLS